jgi:hypothetical protein
MRVLKSLKIWLPARTQRHPVPLRYSPLIESRAIDRVADDAAGVACDIYTGQTAGERIQVHAGNAECGGWVRAVTRVSLRIGTSYRSGLAAPCTLI